MKKIIIFLCLINILVSGLFAQDTINVQTLTFDSITTRRGIWQFPEEGEFRKILMHYTLKCDYATTHDPYPCGEWDYLSYTNVWDHTGVWDSILYHHPSFTFINGNTTDSIEITNSPTYSYTGKTHNSIIFDDTISMSEFTIGEGNIQSENLLSGQHTDARSQFIYLENELTAQGMQAGEINKIKLFLNASDNEIRHFTIKMQNSDLDEIKPENLSNDLEKVFCNTLNLNGNGWYSFSFPEAFIWDGTSNLLIELSFENPEAGINISYNGDNTVWNSGISASTTNYAIDLDGGSDFIDIPDGTYFNGDFTFETWVYKRNNNSWSRVFDFGNGPSNDNIILALSKGTGGKLSISIYEGSSSLSFESPDVLPLNEWTHIAIKLNYGKVGWLYLNGENLKYGVLKTPQNVIRTNNYIGKSNWNNDAYADVIMDEFRIYNYAKEDEQIMADFRKEVNNPAADTSLIAYYNFNSGEGTNVIDHSQFSRNGTMYGYPSWYRVKGPELFLPFYQNNIRPQISFINLQHSSSQIFSELLIDSTLNAKTQLVLFEDENQPTLPTDTIEFWLAGYKYVYENDSIIDSVYFQVDETLYKLELPYYGEPFEILERYEIGRYITPYGINLSLGEEGFTWVYDVTDYASFLKGSVDLNAGNQQELIDLKFSFIEGTPPRKVLSIDRPWGKRASYSYKNLSDNTSLSEITYPLLPDAEQFKVITRLTGHGHHSNTGEYPHCCEWKDNIHYLLIDSTEIANWHIFQYNDCALNPVYPQGGTWNGSREGWCPGDPVKDFEFEITEFITDDSLNIDYDITKVPENNQGMGNGNYVIAMHLMQYGQSSFDNDAEIYDIITPSMQDDYSRINPICTGPEVVIRNNGTSDLTSLNIEYFVSGGNALSFDWTGLIKPNHKQVITLPVIDNSFWIGDDNNIFTVNISQPNNQVDEYSDNNTYKSNFTIPDLYEQGMVFELKTNNQAYRYSMEITDMEGNIVLTRDNLENNTYYHDTLDFEYGCYTLELIDTENMGLYYWAYPEQGSGFLKLFNSEGLIKKIFENDFGRSILFSFNIGDISYIKENNFDKLVTISPNPASDKINIQFNNLQGEINCLLYNSNGQVVRNVEFLLTQNGDKQIDVSDLPSGLYMLSLKNKELHLNKKIIIK